jgi:NAD(P)H-nitrite reductase large subunit
VTERHVLVIGHGVAGLTAAQAARGQDGACAITIVGDEPYDAYYRPRLSHDLATGIQIDKMRLRAPDFYGRQRITVRHAAAVGSLNVGDHIAVLSDGTELQFTACVLATGSRSFMPPIAGGERTGVYALRSAADAIAIRERATAASMAAVAGGGLLGLEVAHGLAGLVDRVIVLERGESLLSRQLDHAGGALLADILGRAGIEVLTRSEVAVAHGSAAADGQPGPLTQLELKDGAKLDCGLLVVAAGVRPRVEVAEAAGLQIDRRGVLVDDRMMTSAADVYACGDVAAHPSGNFGIWPQAMAQGKVAGVNAAGGSLTYVPVVPQNLLTVAGTSVFAVGQAGVLDAAASEGMIEIAQTDIAAGRYAKFRVRDEALVGAMLIGHDALAKVARPAVEARLAVGPILELPVDEQYAALVALIGG